MTWDDSKSRLYTAHIDACSIITPPPMMPSSDRYDVVLLGIRSRRVPSEPYEQTKRRHSNDKLELFIQHRFALEIFWTCLWVTSNFTWNQVLYPAKI